MEIVKYNKYKSGGNSSFVSSNSSSNSSSNTSSNNNSSSSLSRSIWGNNDNGGDISNSMLIYGNIYLNGYDMDSELDDDNDNDSKEKNEDNIINFPPDNEELNGSIYANGCVHSSQVETKDAYVKNHLYVNHSHSEHTGEKVCLINEVETNTKNIKTNADNIETNKQNIASNLTEINNLKTRVTNNEKAIEINATNIVLNEIAIKNNADEIVELKKRATNNETAIQSMMPIGSIIMFNGLSSDIPDNWHICDGTEGTPNLTDKFIKASTTAGQTGGNNEIKLSESHIPELKLHVDNTKIGNDKDWNVRLNKEIHTSDWVDSRVIDTGGSTNYCVSDGENQYDSGLLGVKYTAMFNDVADYTYAGTKAESQGSINIEPSYYSLIFIQKIA